MAITLRPDYRQALQAIIDSQIKAHKRDHQRQGGRPWPSINTEEELSRVERELMVVPTDPVSMKVMAKATLWYHQGLIGRTWPPAGPQAFSLPPDDLIERTRLSPAFDPIVDGDYRIDLLYLSHLDVLKIQVGEAQTPLSEGSTVDVAAVPAHPDRGVPLAYIVLLHGVESIVANSILDVRPYITVIKSKDVDPATWQVFQDFSTLCDGVRTMFAFDLPVAGDRGIVKMNGIVQQPDVAYTITFGGSLSLTFAPSANEILTAQHELGHKDEYSGWGLTPWGTGLWGV